jgi:hypothetical protein
MLNWLEGGARWRIRSFLHLTSYMRRVRVTKERLYFKDRRGRESGIVKVVEDQLKRTEKQKGDTEKSRK